MPAGSDRPRSAAISADTRALASAGGFERVLVAYDGSQRSDEALALALRLLAPASGVLTLACVLVDHRPWRPANADAETEGARAMLAEVRHRVPPGTHVRTEVTVAASGARGLTALAETDGADVIVVGSSRHARPGAVSLERTAGRLLESAPRAVAVAPAGDSGDAPFRHIGVAFDGSPEAHAAVEAAYGLALRDHGAMTIVQALPPMSGEGVSDLADADRRTLRRHAEEQLDAIADAAPAGVNPRTVLAHGRPVEAVKATLAGVVDLLLTGSRGYGPLRRALVGSVSESLIEGAPHPVVVISRTRVRADAGTTATEASA